MQEINLMNLTLKSNNFDCVRNSSPALASLPFGSANRWICGSFRAQISQSETSHIPRPLGDIAKG